MKQLKLRFAGAEDRDKLESLLKANPINQFDKRILDYPTLQTVCAYDDNSEYFLPMHRTMMMESLGPDVPSAAIRDMTKAAELLASSYGIKELYFLDGAGGIGELAKHHGFEEVPYKVYRMRLK